MHVFRALQELWNIEFVIPSRCPLSWFTHYINKSRLQFSYVCTYCLHMFEILPALSFSRTCTDVWRTMRLVANNVQFQKLIEDIVSLCTRQWDKLISSYFSNWSIHYVNIILQRNNVHFLISTRRRTFKRQFSNIHFIFQGMSYLLVNKSRLSQKFFDIYYKLVAVAFNSKYYVFVNDCAII